MNTDVNHPANDDDVADAGNQSQEHLGGDVPDQRDQEEIHAAGRMMAELALPYHLQGDDFAKYLAKAGNVAKALEVHACQMDLAAAMLRSIKEAVAGREVSVEAIGDRILMLGPADVIRDLIDQELLEPE